MRDYLLRQGGDPMGLGEIVILYMYRELAVYQGFIVGRIYMKIDAERYHSCVMTR